MDGYDGRAGTQNKPRVREGPELPGLRGIVDRRVLDAAALFLWELCVQLACQAGDRLLPERATVIRLQTWSEQGLEGTVAFIGSIRPGAAAAEFRRLMDDNRAKSQKPLLTEEEEGRIARLIEPTQSWLGTRPRLGG